MNYLLASITEMVLGMLKNLVISSLLKNLLTIFATHYHSIAEENTIKESKVKNLKLDITRIKDGYKKTFKLREGISSESIVDDLLEDNTE